INPDSSCYEHMDLASGASCQYVLDYHLDTVDSPYYTNVTFRVAATNDTSSSAKLSFNNYPTTTSTVSTNIEDLFSITLDQNGSLYIGGLSGLLVYPSGINYSNETGPITPIKITTANSGLKDNLIYKLFADKNNLIYIGTRKGLSVYNPEQNTWTTYDSSTDGFSSSSFISSIYEFDGNIYAGTTDGLSIYDNTADAWHTVTSTTNGFSSNNIIYSLFVDNSGIYAGTGNGLSIYNYANQTWHTEVRGDSTNEIQGNVISGIAKSSDGKTLYISTGGASVGDDYIASISQSSDDGQSWQLISQTLTNIDAGTVTDIAVDINDYIYAGTLGGPAVSENDGENWTSYTSTVNINFVHDIFTDNHKNLYSVESGGSFYGPIQEFAIIGVN
ncbi:hypothetical protein L3V79_09645, partial [Thiotrichales bacterium 19S9-12]|nr:hypothetical protein [Thiotrichales bacterium 19S9-11]MCF6812615.1 hypothetical protein [Thiotrichales bacterium 19S9-12]